MNLGTVADSDLLGDALADVAEAVDRFFDQRLTVPGDPRDKLYLAMRHAAIGGGKRLRPLLVRAAADIFRVDRNLSLTVGAAVEAMHVYSLIHDDLPCMDDDDLRRGKPTVHKAFDEATAVLAGDSLHALAFEWLAHPDAHPDPFVRAELLLELSRAAGPAGMAGGQMMDLAAESANFDLATVSRLQQLKTGALIAFSVEAGAILGRVPHEGRRALMAYARDIGLAFQIADDIMDVEGDEALAGKALHKDDAAGKETFVTLMGLDRAKAQADLLMHQAVAHLGSFGEEADLLRAIARYVVERDH
ncbi:MAG: polyprenyl synthetase family protein [Sphingopyxis sp.]|nr:polyprenyl synthetase family protein [Sphingopyxis sp.]